MLTYVSAIISVFATICISWITVIQNIKANEISNRLLNLEELNAVPSFSIINDKTNFFEFSKHIIHFKVCLKNIGNRIIDIKLTKTKSIVSDEDLKLLDIFDYGYHICNRH